ncbi:MAG: AAA family ATPase [Moritella sp.]|uniref:AAA family ATPase n=1 Tax=Moritella sp. TaxID=78556 RepID=UPI0029B87E44|nr:AAA family ATPase [Moritella sp.]MDX2322018.1 AAA family ATPase [Moritella sp.]
MSVLLPLIPSSSCLIIIRGVPGSGKSTLAHHFMHTMPNAVHCEADHYFINKQGKYCYDASKIKLAHQHCQQNMHDALSKGLSVVVSNTTIKKWELTALLDIAASYNNIETHIIHCCGQFSSTHNVPADIVARMALSYEPHPDESRYIPS